MKSLQSKSTQPQSSQSAYPTDPGAHAPRNRSPHRASLDGYEALVQVLALGGNLLGHLDAKTRLGLSIMVGMSLFLCLPDSMHLDLRILTGWIAGVLLFLTLVVLMMNSATPAKTRYRAQRQEAQHMVVFLLVVMTACTSIFAIGLLQANNGDQSATTIALEAGLSLVAVVCSWFLTHTLFALHYATCYYRWDSSQESGFAGGLDFPGDDLPDYWDFMYFTFTIGMTAQTSDVAIPGLFLRRLAIAHGVVSFFFYMVIIASSVNVASGLM